MNEAFYKGRLREAQDLAVQIIKETRALLLDPFQLIAAITSAELTTWPKSKGPAPRELYMKRYQALLVQVTLSVRPNLSTLQALADAAEQAKPTDWQIDVTLACMQASETAGDDPQQLVDTCVRGLAAGEDWLRQAAAEGGLDPRSIRTVVNRVNTLSTRCLEPLQRMLAENTALTEMQGASTAVVAEHCKLLCQYAQIHNTQLQCQLRFASHDMSREDVASLCEGAAAVAQQAADGWATGQLEGVNGDILRPLHAQVMQLVECIVCWAFSFENWPICELLAEQISSSGVALSKATEAREVMALWAQLGAEERNETAEGIKTRLDVLTADVLQDIASHPAPVGNLSDLPQCGIDRRKTSVVNEERFQLQRVHYVATLARVYTELGQQSQVQALVQAMRSSLWPLAYPHFQPLMQVILNDDIHALPKFEEDALLFLKSAADPWEIWRRVCHQMLLAAQVTQLAHVVAIGGNVMPQLAAQKSTTRRCVRDIRAAFIVCHLLHYAPQAIYVDEEHYVAAVLTGLWASANHAAGPDAAVMRLQAALQNSKEARDVQNMTARAVALVKAKQGPGSAAAAECRAIEEQCAVLLEAFESGNDQEVPFGDQSSSSALAAAAGSGAQAGSTASSVGRKKKSKLKEGSDSDEDSDSSFEAQSSDSSEADVQLEASESSGDDSAFERKPGGRAGAARRAGPVKKNTGRAAPRIAGLSRRSADYNLILSRILNSSAVPSIGTLSSLYTASRSAANLPWAHGLVTLLGRMELMCIRPQSTLCGQAAAAGHSIYSQQAVATHRPMVVPPASLKRAVRDTVLTNISTPQLMAVVNKSSDIQLALSVLVHLYDVWRASMRHALPAELRRDVHHTATMHHPLLDLLESSICLRYLASRATRNRHATFMRGLASINSYAALRPAHAAAAPEAALPYLTEEQNDWLRRHQLSAAAVEIEVQYNLGRWHHTAGMLPAALQHYTAAMQASSACEAFVAFRNTHGYRHAADLGIDAAASLLVMLNHHTPRARWCLTPEHRQLLEEQLAVGPVPVLRKQPSRGVLDRM